MTRCLTRPSRSSLTTDPSRVSGARAGPVGTSGGGLCWARAAPQPHNSAMTHAARRDGPVIRFAMPPGVVMAPLLSGDFEPFTRQPVNLLARGDRHDRSGLRPTALGERQQEQHRSEGRLRLAVAVV